MVVEHDRIGNLLRYKSGLWIFYKIFTFFLLFRLFDFNQGIKCGPERSLTFSSKSKADLAAYLQRFNCSAMNELVTNFPQKEDAIKRIFDQFDNSTWIVSAAKGRQVCLPI